MAKRKIRKEDRDWAKKIKERDGECVICGAKEYLNAHHIIPREIKEFKYDLKNGITLCPRHHRFSYELSAHQNPLSFFMWLEQHRPMLLRYLRDKIHERAIKRDY